MPDDNDIVDGELVEPDLEAEAGGTALSEHLAGDNAVPFIPTPEGYEEIELEATRKTRQEANQRKVQLLESAGVGLAPALLGCRLEALIEWAVGGEDTEQRRNFDASFEEKLEPLLDQVASQVRAQMLQRDAAAGAKLLAADGRAPLRGV